MYEIISKQKKERNTYYITVTRKFSSTVLEVLDLENPTRLTGELEIFLFKKLYLDLVFLAT